MVIYDTQNRQEFSLLRQSKKKKTTTDNNKNSTKTTVLLWKDDLQEKIDEINRTIDGKVQEKDIEIYATKHEQGNLKKLKVIAPDSKHNSHRKNEEDKQRNRIQHPLCNAISNNTTIYTTNRCINTNHITPDKDTNK